MGGIRVLGLQGPLTATPPALQAFLGAGPLRIPGPGEGASPGWGDGEQLSQGSPNNRMGFLRIPPFRGRIFSEFSDRVWPSWDSTPCGWGLSGLATRGGLLHGSTHRGRVSSGLHPQGQFQCQAYSGLFQGTPDSRPQQSSLLTW